MKQSLLFASLATASALCLSAITPAANPKVTLAAQTQELKASHVKQLPSQSLKADKGMNIKMIGGG